MCFIFRFMRFVTNSNPLLQSLCVIHFEKFDTHQIMIQRDPFFAILPIERASNWTKLPMQLPAAFITPHSHISKISHNSLRECHAFLFFQQMLLNLSFIIFFKKIKFKGKGYYMYKNKRNGISFRFNYAHRNYRYVPMLFIKVRSKNSLIFCNSNYNILHASLITIRNVRSINIFTNRGIRFSRQIVRKKTGKISSFR